jgi:para-nitrobenzyl esterase
MMPPETAADTTRMLLKHLEIDKGSWRKLLDVPVDQLVAAQVALGQQPGAGPLSPRGGRSGMSGNRRPGGFGPVVDGTVLPRHPFDPDAPAISKHKPLIVGYNRDETTFFLQREPAVFALTEEGLKQRLAKELEAKAEPLYAAYRQARPNASPTDLYIAISSASMFGIGSVAIAERKHAQGGAPVYAYVFTHGSDRIIPGTTHRLGAAHAFEIRFKFNLVEPGGAGGGSDPMAISGPDSVKTARNMSEMWSTFARTGRPAAQGQPAWPAYTTPRRATMEIDAQCRVVDDPHSAERQTWEKVDS